MSTLPIIRMLNGPNAKNLVSLLVIAFLGQAGASLISPLLPTLLESLTGRGAAYNSVWSAWMFSVYGLMQFFFGPVIGKLSDRYGRRPVLLACALSYTVDYMIMASATDIYILLIGRTLAGITGASIVAAFASAADVSEPDERATNFAALSVASSFGIIIGPAISGALAQFGVRTPFWCAAALCLLNFIFIAASFKETVIKSTEAALGFKNPLSSLMHFWRRPGMKLMLSAHLMFVIAAQAPAVILTFLCNSRFGWGPREISYVLIFLGASAIFVQTFIIRIMYAKFGEKSNFYFGFIAVSIGILGIGIARYPVFIYLSIAFYALGSISNPAIMSAYSSSANRSEQGEMLGVLSAVASAGGIIGPFIMSNIYRYSLDQHFFLGDGTPFLFSSFLVIGSMLLFSRAFSSQIGCEPR